MALTATLCWVDKNTIAYRLVNVATLGTTVTITAAGTATPDLVTDGASTSYGQANGSAPVSTASAPSPRRPSPRPTPAPSSWATAP
jgi:hypothetical protein